ncbi:MAG: Asp-tRNA(Asn)/Glu-tRNA(Gln) amidotransferase subunit GatA [Deltaproteobacteria bacterium]|nr:Asp-tRNA(Asn)/Glu-tRNA(Gln) amidotransferase subunit GatA [Deltaproteobacteria bacterium]
MELCDMSAVELGRLLRKGEITSREVTLSALRRIEEKESDLKAYITVTADLALEMADRADRRFRNGEEVSPLEGIPVAVKDVLCTEGIRTTCGSRILADYVPPYHATAVRKVLESGAVLLGKTNMDEFGMGSSTENSAFGPTHNPADPERVPGGSSGGSAAAVAAGETVIALGSDTGGSIRLPAAYCGVVGLKPTYGRVSRFGLIAYASSLDQVGPIARTVEDCALLLECVSGHDRRDTTSAGAQKRGFADTLKRGVRGLRIGLPREYFVEGLDPKIRDRILEAVRLLERNGGRIVDVSLPHTKYAISAYYLIATAEASSNLARYDGVRYGYRTDRDVSDTVRMVEVTRSEGFGREVKRRIILGTYVLSAGYYDAYYLKAQKVRTLVKQDFDRALELVDCMIAPVSPFSPFRLGEKTEDPLQMYLVDVYTVSLNLAGLPGLSLPCGNADGLPVGMQIIGRPFDEATVLRVGYAYEQMRALE